MKDAPSDSPVTTNERLATVFLGLSSLFFCLCIVLAAGWYFAWKQGSTLDIEKLTLFDSVLMRPVCYDCVHDSFSADVPVGSLPGIDQ